MICSVVGVDQGFREIVASKTGYNPVTREFRNYGDGVHFQLTRR